ncbi:HNH endonuclease [Paenibacillus sp. Soil522]|uniref:HNH endonuclease n=1 Tax=Paenibacillus sp. Soil522 TaxID=1736388 RepID=UPI0006FEFC0F|nr:HNH endonuclease [Paenibacillus sp. Soil522]KRE45820.1 hypothetical protein ASG81_12385 [Paenibacillus sp. Soil522]
MKYDIVIDLVGLINSQSDKLHNYKVTKLRQDQIETVHKRTSLSFAIDSFFIEKSTGEALYFLFTDWHEKKDGNYHLILFQKVKSSSPIVELHQTQTISHIGVNLLWKYAPKKHDIKNPERIAYFKHYFGGDVNVSISIPTSPDKLELFIDDLFALVDNRLKADELSEDAPEVRREFPEGRLYEKLHKQRERSSKVVKLAKQNMKQQLGKLICQVCHFDFGQTYGALGEDFIEAHHTIPVSELNGNSITKIEDIALVCSNCHRMLHRKRPWLGINQLKSILQAPSSVT